MRPVADYMILEMDKKPESKIVIPDTVDQSKDESTIFTVVAVGPGHMESGILIEPEVEIGDRVFMMAFAVSKLEYKGKKVILGRARDVVLILNGEEVNTEDAGDRSKIVKARFT